MPNDRFVRLVYNMLKYMDELGHSNIVQRLKDQYMQDWTRLISESHKLSLFRNLNTDYRHAPYLNNVKIRKFRSALAKLRCSAHNLEVESGRYYNTPYENRICKICQLEVETEYHFIMKCTTFNDLRIKYLPSKYYNNPNMHKFHLLLNTTTDSTVNNLAMFIFYALKLREEFVNNNLP